MLAEAGSLSLNNHSWVKQRSALSPAALCCHLERARKLSNCRQTLNATALRTSLDSTTDQDDEIGLDPDDSGDNAPAVVAGPLLDNIVARNDKTKIVHECRDRITIYFQRLNRFANIKEPAQLRETYNI